MKHAIQLCALVSTLAVCGGAAQAQPRPGVVEYCLTHIWTPDYERQLDFHVTDINDKAEVVGYGAGPQASQGAFLWRKGQFIDMGLRVGHAQTTALGLNDHGDIVGTYSDDGRESQAFLLRHGRLIHIQGVPGVGSTVPLDVNNKRQVVLSRAADAFGLRTAFMWDRSGIAPLEPLLSNTVALAQDMNDRGAVVGVSGDSESDQFLPVLWQDGTVMELPQPEGAFRASARFINKRGQVAMTALVPTVWPYYFRAFIWHEGKVSALPLFEDSHEMFLTGFNDQGIAVGQSFTPTRTVPTVWRDGQALDLNTLICSGDPQPPDVQLDAALLINNRGQIVARGLDARFGPQTYWLLTPQERSMGSP